jgi:hypothetical protein
VSVNARLDASVDYTYANDLTIYVDPPPLSPGGLLHVGGFSNLGATERHAWANGDSDTPGTTVIDTVTLTTPLTFHGNASDPAIYLGNGYGAPNSSGTWTGSVTLNFASVPEPAITSANTTTFTVGTVGNFNVIATASNGVGNNAVQNFSLVVNPSASAVKSGSKIQKNAGGGYLLGFIGNPGQQYTLQYVDFLPATSAQWNLLSSQTANANGTISITIPAPGAGVTKRFYRAIVP